MEKRITDRIREELLSMQDLPYREFHCKLMPTVDKMCIRDSKFAYEFFDEKQACIGG